MRLNKFIAHNFGLSRREADTAIEEGRVKVNQKPTRVGQAVSELTDIVELDGQPNQSAINNYSYVLMNKPTNYVCSRRQQGEAPTIYDLLPQQMFKLKVAGRLDKDSCGLILLTDDGDTIFQLTHPSFKKQKIYHIQLNIPLQPVDLSKLNSGITLEDGVSNLKIKQTNLTPENPTFQVVMSEGRNRQIRRTLNTLGYRITFLQRQSFGPYSLGQLSGELYAKVPAK